MAVPHVSLFIKDFDFLSSLGHPNGMLPWTGRDHPKPSDIFGGGERLEQNSVDLKKFRRSPFY